MKKKCGNWALAFLIVLLSLLMPISRVWASNKDWVLYSDDFFVGDQIHCNRIVSLFTAASHNCGITARPSAVNGISGYLQNSNCFYISTHGLSSGS